MKIVLCLVSLLALSANADSSKFYTKNGHFIAGYDPVSYTQSSGPQKGKSKFSSMLGDTKVLFSSAGNKALFEADPKKYTPAYNGYCAYAMAKNQLYKVDPKNFKVIEGKVHLFYESLFIDTQKKWNKNEKAFKTKADAFWATHDRK